MFLERIVATKREEVQQLQARITTAELERQISDLKACRGFEQALRTGRNRKTGLIAEVKKASPSKGLIRADFDPVRLAEAYTQAGTDCISVLTDVQYFQGANDYLSAVHEAVHVPLLRKDFIIHPAQILEARVIGADAILLIASILNRAEMKQFLGLARDYGMDVLVEVHDRREMETVLELDATLVGINNRNLKTFVTDIRTTEELASIVPKDRLLVSESGISSRDDLDFVYKSGAGAVLIGEHFMRQPDVSQAVEDLMGKMEGIRA
ncbi:indole-3-glycerol phosphate synthase TrpC [Paenibacillus lutrae]|uniref:Indole-3-glycerol phosphate synthase n=1 Tax=Paenibacillus lutrae TaxID=2078573 RepID=A0A7X3FI51_9BACL|nr:indole-3-glycerol phosphate synthase TrpC [Paenibacillus lutrae]MVP00033.1 indole-3-glycerol phosphate synthase TrpC [Paenibacillus lutrae]